MDAYVPVYSENGNTWFPSNERAVTLVKLVHAWRDISKLNEIRLGVRSNDPIADKLILKFMLVEFFSALDHARKLQGLIRTAPKLIAGRPAPYRYVTKKELACVTDAYKALWVELAPLESLIADIRNNMGAHRSAEIGFEVESLWNKLDPDRFIHLINHIPSIIKAAKEINIYDWSWMDANANIGSIFGTQLTHDWEDAFNQDESTPQ